MIILEQIKTFVVDIASTLFAKSFFSSIFIVWGASLLPFFKTRFKWKTVLAVALILFGLVGVFYK